MIVRCQDCSRVYDDVDLTVICPHPPIGIAPKDYCPVHDLVRLYQPEAFEHLGCPHDRRLKRVEELTVDEGKVAAAFAAVGSAASLAMAAIVGFGAELKKLSTLGWPRRKGRCNALKKSYGRCYLRRPCGIHQRKEEG